MKYYYAIIDYFPPKKGETPFFKGANLIGDFLSREEAFQSVFNEIRDSAGPRHPISSKPKKYAKELFPRIMNEHEILELKEKYEERPLAGFTGDLHKLLKNHVGPNLDHEDIAGLLDMERWKMKNFQTFIKILEDEKVI